MKKPKRKDKRTTISLDPIVWGWAEERMDEEGFNGNISQYVAALIRKDKERSDESKKGTKFPNRPSRLELNERSGEEKQGSE